MPGGWVAFVLGAFWIYGIGLSFRLPAFADRRTGIAVSLGVDTVFLLLLLAGQAMQRRLLLWPALRRQRPAVLLPAAVAGMLGYAVLAAALMILVAGLLAGWGGLTAAPYAWFRQGQVAYYGLVSLTWALTAAWLGEKRREMDSLLAAAAARQAAMDAEVRLLRLQLDSHFLFNALNAIAVEVQDSPRRALRLVRDLSQYLRYSLDTADRVLVPVSAELAALRCFLRVQEVRFGSRLAFRVEQAGAARGRLVPAFLVQPLVENAAKHGIPGDDGVLRVAVSVLVDGDATLIRVDSSGDLLPPAAAVPRPPGIGTGTGTGTGLVNLRRRLAIHYPGRHGFSLRQHGALVRAELRLWCDAC